MNRGHGKKCIGDEQDKTLDFSDLQVVGYTGANRMARRRFQQGSVMLEKRKDGAKVWVGRFWANEISPKGRFSSRRRKVVLGNCQEMTKAMARRQLQPYIDGQNNFLQSVRNGEPVNPKSMVSFETIAEKWQEQILSYSAKGTQELRKCYLNKYILPVFGKMAIGDITKEMLQLFIKQLEKRKVDYSSINNIKGTLSGVFNCGVDYGYTKTNPTKGLKLPKYEAPEKPLLELSHVQAVISGLNGVHKTAAYLLAETGLRSGELAGLEVGDINLQKQTLSVRRSYRSMFGTHAPKTKSSKRTLRLSDHLTGLLQEVIGERKEGQLLSIWKRGHLSVASLLLRVRQILDRLGLDSEKYNLHSFRHFNASLMISLRINLKVAKARLGHSMADDITLGTYTHVFSEDEREAAEAIASALLGKKEEKKAEGLIAELNGLAARYGLPLEEVFTAYNRMNNHGQTAVAGAIQ